jgi:predicted DNA-binding transcriptional regulator YafY
LALTLRLPKGRATKPGRTRGKFTQFRRLDALRTLLEEHPVGLTLAELATTLRVSQRSARRYIHEMQEALQLEWVEPVPGGAKVWRVKPGERGRAVVLRRGQAQALLATRRVFEAVRGSAFFDEVDVAFTELQKLVQRPSGRTGKGQELMPDTTLGDRATFLASPSRVPPARTEEVDVVLQAFSQGRAITFSPRGQGAAKATRATFFPYGVVFHQGSVVLVGWLEHERRLAVVRLEETHGIEATDTGFRVPEGFELTDYLHGEFGVALPDKTRMLVEFDARVADQIRAKKVHPAQRIAQAPDGRVRVSAPLGDRALARAWVLGFGDAAKVIEPKDLADEIRDMLVRAAARY